MIEILRTHKISAAIIDLIEETKQHCYLVTPYLTPWVLLNRALDHAATQRKRITLVVRDEPASGSKKDNFKEIERANRARGFEIIGLKRLHSKIYVNEKIAIVGSMNLYDSSAENNFEAAVRLTGADAARVRTELVERELLVAKRENYAPGWFSEDVEAAITALEHQRTEMASRGYCVCCGERMNLDTKEYLVRCTSCWNRNQDADKRFFKIHHCHFCGTTLTGTLDKPLHYECGLELGRFVELEPQYGGRVGQY